mgnify:CR=1 FL=1
MFNLIVIKGCLFGKDGFQQFPQLGDIPLFIAQVIDKLTHGLFRFYLKDFIEGTAGGDDAQIDAVADKTVKQPAKTRTKAAAGSGKTRTGKGGDE